MSSFHEHFGPASYEINFIIKPFASPLTEEELNDIDCDFGPTFSYVRCVCVKSISEPNYLPEDDDYILINESCLYYSDGNDAYAFAHICFPPKYVEKKSEFVVEWYILC